MTMGLVDSFIVGRVSARDMGAVALGNGVAGVLTVLGVGLAMGIEPLVSQAHGAGETEGARRWLWQGVWLSAIVALPLAITMIAVTRLFAPFGVPHAIDTTTTAYLWARLPGVGFNTIYTACRSYLSSIGRTRPILVAVISANLLNAIADSVLVFSFGLGAVGVGVATSICWMLMSAIALVSVFAPEARVRRGFQVVRPHAADLLKVLRLGYPVGLQLAVEVGIFALVSLMIARFGETALAGHQIAITLASATFMCAVGIAVASTARVGHHVGAGRSELARRTGLLAMGMGGAFMALGGVVFILFGEALGRLFAPTDPVAAHYGATLLRIAAVFSISDGIQVVAAGALRGAGDTKWPFYANLLSHWLIGLPLLLLLGHVLGMGPAGYWWGLTAGLSIVAAILSVRFVRLSSRPIARV